MDAHALLTSQGWRGSGHSLHPTDESRGLKRPLLVSKKQNNAGVGKKQHKTSDMWWMNAFDSSLKGLDTSTQGQVIQTMTSGALDMVVKGGAKWVGSKGGLYSTFVRGEALLGTFDSPLPELPDVATKQEPVPEVKTETTEERRVRKAARRLRRAQKALAKAKSTGSGPEGQTQSIRLETKEERRERRRRKYLLRQTKSTSPASKALHIDAPKKKRRKENADTLS